MLRYYHLFVYKHCVAVGRWRESWPALNPTITGHKKDFQCRCPTGKHCCELLMALLRSRLHKTTNISVKMKTLKCQWLALPEHFSSPRIHMELGGSIGSINVEYFSDRLMTWLSDAKPHTQTQHTHGSLLSTCARSQAVTAVQELHSTI